MTLYEISLDYQDSAAVLQLRLRELRAERAGCRTPRQVKAMDRRIRTLTPLLQQCRELAQLTEHYYERGCCRNERYRL